MSFVVWIYSDSHFVSRVFPFVCKTVFNLCLIIDVYYIIFIHILMLNRKLQNAEFHFIALSIVCFQLFKRKYYGFLLNIYTVAHSAKPRYKSKNFPFLPILSIGVFYNNIYMKCFMGCNHSTVNRTTNEHSEFVFIIFLFSYLLWNEEE